MEQQPARVIYCVDMSSLVNVQRTYPLVFLPGLWEQMGRLADEGRLIAPREVFNELERGGDDEIFQWAKDHKSMFQDPDNDEIEIVKEIVNNSRFSGLFDITSEKPDADPYVIALAAIRQRSGTMFQETWVVVADESRVQPGRKPRIPDVCSDAHYGLECIRVLDMFIREGWNF